MRIELELRKYKGLIRPYIEPERQPMLVMVIVVMMAMTSVVVEIMAMVVTMLLIVTMMTRAVVGPRQRLATQGWPNKWPGQGLWVVVAVR